MKTDKRKKKVFTYIALLLVFTIIAQLAVLFFDLPHNSFFLHAGSVLALFAFAVWHSIIKKGIRNTLIFILLAMGISFLAEFIGMRYGVFYGSAYSYASIMGPTVGSVPILVIIMWAAVIYISFMVSEHILNYTFLRKLGFRHKLELSFFTSIVAALATVAWDLTLDPLAVINGWWEWQDGGAYFPSIRGGVPTGNFAGWILVAFIVVFLFKLFIEEVYYEKETTYDYAPVLAYTLLLVSNIGLSLEAGQPILALVGLVTMGPFISIIMARFIIVKHKLPHYYKH